MKQSVRSYRTDDFTDRCLQEIADITGHSKSKVTRDAITKLRAETKEVTKC